MGVSALWYSIESAAEGEREEREESGRVGERGRQATLAATSRFAMATRKESPLAESCCVLKWKLQVFRLVQFRRHFDAAAVAVAAAVVRLVVGAFVSLSFASDCRFL